MELDMQNEIIQLESSSSTIEINQNEANYSNKNIKNHCKTDSKIGINNRLTKNEKNKLMQNFMEKIFEKLEDLQKNHQQILVVDRFEENIAVCEDRETKKMINISVTDLPENVKEGDVIKHINNKYELDEKTTLEIEERINEKVKDLFED